MTDEMFVSILKSIKLPLGELLYDGTTYRVTYKYFNVFNAKQRQNLCDFEKFLVISDGNENVVGGVLFYGNCNLQAVVFPKYRGKHFMSKIHKNNILKSECYPNQVVTIEKDYIESFDDFNKKHYLLSCANLKVHNLQEVYDYMYRFSFPGIEKYTKESFIAKYS
jgi:hypothetical protein